jgi:hypothetical protein
MTKKKRQEISEVYYYNSSRSRICKMSLYFSKLNIPCSSRQHSHILTTTQEAWFHGKLQCMPLGHVYPIIGISTKYHFTPIILGYDMSFDK